MTDTTKLIEELDKKLIIAFLDAARAGKDTGGLSNGQLRGLLNKLRSPLSSLAQKVKESVEQEMLGKVKLMGYIDSNTNVQMLDEAHVKEIVRMVLKEKQ